MLSRPHSLSRTNWNCLATRADPRTWTYTLYDGQQQATVTYEDVLHIRWHESASRPWEGRSPISVLASSSARLLEATDRLMHDTYRFGASVGYVASSKEKLTDEEMAGLGKQITLQFAGENGTKRNGVLVLSAAEFHRLEGMTPADADLRALRAQLQEDIARAAGVPVELLLQSQGPAARESQRRFVLWPGRADRATDRTRAAGQALRHHPIGLQRAASC